MLAGSWEVSAPVVAAAAAGLVLASVYSLAMIHRSMFGPARDASPIAGANVRELLMLLSLAAAILWLGLHPQPLIDLAAGPVARVQQFYAPAMH